MHDRASAKPPRVRFAAFTVDTGSGELWRDDRRVPIQQKPFRLLAALVSRPGELVTREELRYAVWHESTHVAFERGLTVAAAKLRQALGDSATEPRYIETLPGRGYRLIAPVVPAEGRVDRRSARIRWMAAAIVVGVLSITGSPQLPGRSADRLAAAEALSAYACELKTDGRVEEALSVIEKAHALAPEHARFTAEVGFHLHANRQYEAEMRMLRLAVTQDPGSAPAWLHLGLGLARRQQMVEAIAALEQAATVDPADTEVRRWLDWARAESRTSG